MKYGLEGCFERDSVDEAQLLKFRQRKPPMLPCLTAHTQVLVSVTAIPSSIADRARYTVGFEHPEMRFWW